VAAYELVVDAKGEGAKPGPSAFGLLNYLSAS